ncbi:hypothetical protein TNCV_4647411 [Trichonephila clavipes]|uniref:Uncharacterized protein n=1 Tax=Trichonephila clavipes TaxID=2585209 RepID=A0A8X6VRS4_TRICX|nr:hypothetical protein TNCV_4647411 [Trichonephila clavipes]
MSSRHHIDDFMRGRIIGKIEEGRKITDVAREFDIAHGVASGIERNNLDGQDIPANKTVADEVRSLMKEMPCLLRYDWSRPIIAESGRGRGLGRSEKKNDPKQGDLEIKIIPRSQSKNKKGENKF